MRQLRKFFLLVLALCIMAGAAACGGSGKTTGDTAATEATAADNGTAADNASAADSSSKTDSTAASSVEVGVVQDGDSSNEFPPVDETLTDASVLGEWTDISSPDRYAKITKTDSGYQYEDNDGKYDGSFKNGELTLQVSDTDNAHVYYDAKSQNLITIYQGTPTRFKKKG